MSQITSQFDNALRVLAITVIVDQRVRDKELEAFCDQSVGMAPLCGIDGFDSNTAMSWFKSNEADIRESLTGRGKNTIILKAVTRITDDIVREALYDSMLAISISDDEYHRTESDFVRSAAAIWGFVRPPFKVIDGDS